MNCITSQASYRMDRQEEEADMDEMVQYAFEVRERMIQRCRGILLPLTINQPTDYDRMLHPKRAAYRHLSTPPDADLALEWALLYGHLAWVAFKGWKVYA